LTKRLHLAQRTGGRSRPRAALLRAGRACGLFLVLAAGLSGCRHNTNPVVLAQTAHAPIELETVPPPDSPPTIATLPAPEPAPLPPPPPPATTRRRAPAPAPPKETQPPVQVASAEPAAAAIGSLSSGGDSTAQNQQQAKDLIASILKRIAALPAKTADSKKEQVRQVKRFLDQAQQALNSGDADGAKNLATKAGLLMDDLEKK
jgi:hypothetical protein